VFVGDTILTSAQSALSLRLGTATLVRLGPDAALRIDRYLMNVGGTLELARGPMVFLHDPGAAAPGVAVRSPFGLIAVRGTRFFAGPSNGVFGVFVDEGAVSVVGVNTAVEVTAGLGTDIAHPGEEPTNPHPWGRARIEAAFASVR
ncbi:MAG: FecR domain-containing protein, partial [Alphaproteobacteria bacterium]|nr:FecR domain-containing protein [Alphaproteobacteria bacterium]